MSVYMASPLAKLCPAQESSIRFTSERVITIAGMRTYRRGLNFVGTPRVRVGWGIGSVSKSCSHGRNVMPYRKLSTFAFSAVFATMLAMVQAQADEATAEKCETEWKKSSADHTCGETEAIEAIAYTDLCWIRQGCEWYDEVMFYGLKTSRLRITLNNVRIPLADVSRTQNCDGWLTVGSC